MPGFNRCLLYRVYTTNKIIDDHRKEGNVLFSDALNTYYWQQQVSFLTIRMVLNHMSDAI